MNGQVRLASVAILYCLCSHSAAAADLQKCVYWSWLASRTAHQELVLEPVADGKSIDVYVTIKKKKTAQQSLIKEGKHSKCRLHLTCKLSNEVGVSLQSVSRTDVMFGTRRTAEKFFQPGANVRVVDKQGRPIHPNCKVSRITKN